MTPNPGMIFRYVFEDNICNNNNYIKMSLNGVGAKQRYSPLKKPLLTCTSMGERNGGVLP